MCLRINSRNGVEGGFHNTLICRETECYYYYYYYWNGGGDEMGGKWSSFIIM